MERFDESLLVLSNMLKINKKALLYLKAKESGKDSTDKDEVGTKQTRHPALKEESNHVQHIAERLEKGEDADNLNKANIALDEAIVSYGSNFQADLAEFQQRLALIEEKCRAHFFESCLWN